MQSTSSGMGVGRTYFASEVYRSVYLLALFLMSCLGMPELILDDPAFREDMIRRVIQGDRFIIDLDDLADIEDLMRDEQNPQSRLAGLILASEMKESEMLNEQIVLMTLDDDKQISVRALWQIEKDPERYRNYLMKLLDSKDEQLRHDALWIIGNTGFPESWKIFAGSFGDSSKVVRDEASIQFYMSTGRESPVLQELLQSPFPATAATAYLTLSRYRDPVDLPVLISAIDSNVTEIQLAAKKAVFRFGELALPLLHSLVADPVGKKSERMAALELIQAIGSNESLNFLFDLLDDEAVAARVRTILTGYKVWDTAILEDIFRRSDFEVQFQIITMLNNAEKNETAEIIERLLQDMPKESISLFLDNLSEPVDNFVFRHLVVKGNDEVALIALKRLLDNSTDPWIITEDGEEINYRAIRLMIMGSSLDEIRSYLNPDLPGISRLWKESFVLLKQVWDSSGEFLDLEKRIISGRGSYVYARHLREVYLVSSREELERSFEELHSYFRNSDPASLARSEKSRIRSRQLNAQAREQMNLIESMSKEVQTRGEEQFMRFGKIRDMAIRAWEFCPPELREFFRDMYREAGLDAEKIARGNDFRVN